MKKYLITGQDGYSVRFYLVGEEEKNILLTKKSWELLPQVDKIPCFRSMKDVMQYLKTNNCTLGAEEFVLYSSDIVVNQ